MRITPSTAVRRMDRPFLVTDRITFSSVSSRYMMSSSYDVHTQHTQGHTDKHTCMIIQFSGNLPGWFASFKFLLSNVSQELSPETDAAA